MTETRLTLRTPVDGGRTHRRDITDAGLAAVRKMAASGNSKVTIARILGVHPDTLAEMAKRDERVDLALQEGLAALADELTDMLLKMARKGNVAAAIYLTKARLGWREGDAPDTRPNITINLPDSASPEQYMKRVVNTKDEA